MELDELWSRCWRRGRREIRNIYLPLAHHACFLSSGELAVDSTLRSFLPMFAVAQCYGSSEPQFEAEGCAAEKGRRGRQYTKCGMHISDNREDHLYFMAWKQPCRLWTPAGLEMSIRRAYRTKPIPGRPV